DGDGIGGDTFERGSGGAEVVEKSEVGGFVDADAAAAKATIGEGLACEFCGAFVLLPDADVGGEAELLAKPAFLKGRADKNGAAAARKKKCEEALAGPPTNAREI